MEIADVIAFCESNNNQWAQRFERLHLKVTRPAVVARIARINHCSQDTADVYASMSHGLFQIMGFNLYGDDINYQSPIYQFLNSRNDQKAVFDQYLRLDHLEMLKVSDLETNEKARLHFAACYNGPSNVESYAARLIQTIDILRRATQ